MLTVGGKVASAYVAGSKWNWSPSGLLAMDAVSQGAAACRRSWIPIVRGVVRLTASFSLDQIVVVTAARGPTAVLITQRPFGLLVTAPEELVNPRSRPFTGHRPGPQTDCGTSVRAGRHLSL